MSWLPLDIVVVVFTNCVELAARHVYGAVGEEGLVCLSVCLSVSCLFVQHRDLSESVVEDNIDETDAKVKAKPKEARAPSPANESSKSEGEVFPGNEIDFVLALSNRLSPSLRSSLGTLTHFTYEYKRCDG